MNIQENFSLKNSNTFGVDVSTKYFAVVSSVDELLHVLTQRGQVTHFVEKIPSVNDIFIKTVSK